MKILPPLAALAMTACASLPGDDIARTLALAETQFAAHSIREDMRVAFIAHFAPEGVFVRDGWANARAVLAGQPKPPFILDWSPRYVETAGSGDLGLSTGPWKLTSRDKPDRPALHGQFASVWTRAPDGPWQVLVDLGISHPQAALWDAALEARPSPGVGGAETLAQAEADFAQASARAGLREAYRHRGASDLRLYREGEAPRDRLDTSLASAWLQRTANASWRIEAQRTAASGELGYARGTLLGPGGTKPAGYWLRVWRREAAGWRIAMDVLTPTKD